MNALMKFVLGFGLLAFVAMVSGCTRVQEVYYYNPAPVNLPVRAVEACEAHAGGVQQARYGQDFRFILANANGLGVYGVPDPVGTQQVAMALDGTADLWRSGEYRKVRWHCLVNPDGRVVYSFVRNM